MKAIHAASEVSNMFWKTDQNLKKFAPGTNYFRALLPCQSPLPRVALVQNIVHLRFAAQKLLG